MRFNILVFALLASATSAQAGSIDTVATGVDSAHSIEKIGCAECVARSKKPVQAVVELAPGTQKIVIRDVDGVKKIFRTEAWLGGSPVTYVSKAYPDEIAAAAAQPTAQTTETDQIATAPDVIKEQPAVDASMIDEKAKTSAVTADAGAQVKVEIAPKPVSFDAGKLEFRLD